VYVSMCEKIEKKEDMEDEEERRKKIEEMGCKK
jgi:hypothetical protein